MEEFRRRGVGEAGPSSSESDWRRTIAEGNDDDASADEGADRGRGESKSEGEVADGGGVVWALAPLRARLCLGVLAPSRALARA